DAVSRRGIAHANPCACRWRAHPLMAAMDIDADAGQLTRLANHAQAMNRCVVARNAECARGRDHLAAFDRVAAGWGQGRWHDHQDIPRGGDSLSTTDMRELYEYAKGSGLLVGDFSCDAGQVMHRDGSRSSAKSKSCPPRKRCIVFLSRRIADAISAAS